jgi:hypothetical protein
VTGAHARNKWVDVLASDPGIARSFAKKTFCSSIKSSSLRMLDFGEQQYSQWTYVNRAAQSRLISPASQSYQVVTESSRLGRDST